MNFDFDVIIIGAGAAGLMCAASAGARAAKELGGRLSRRELQYERHADDDLRLVDRLVLDAALAKGRRRAQRAHGDAVPGLQRTQSGQV